MFNRIIINNILGINNKVELNFIAGPKKKEKKETVIEIEPNINVNKVIGIIGPNASGKSSIIHSLLELRIFLAQYQIVETAKEKKDEKMLKYMSNRFLPERNLENFRDKKLIALTFDDGPSKKNTNKLLNALDCYHARVTFFVLGSRVYSNRNTIKRAYDMGNQIGSHTYSHTNLTKLNNDNVINEINNTNSAIRNVIGVNPTLLRPPYGSVNDRVNSLVNMNIILWNVDTLDWKYKDANRVKDEIVTEVSEIITELCIYIDKRTAIQ